MYFFIISSPRPGFKIPAEPAADEAVADLPDDEDEEGGHQHHPTQGQKDEGDFIQHPVTVGLLVCELELDMVYCVVVPQGRSEWIQILLPQNVVELVRQSVSEDPPRDCDHPDDHEDHHEHVVHHTATKLTETPHNLITAMFIVLYTPKTFG